MGDYLWAWGILMTIILFQFLLFEGLPRILPGLSWKTEGGEVTAAATFAAAASLQGPMLLFFLGFRAFGPPAFRFPLNSEAIPPASLIRRSLYLFLLMMPLVWAVNIGWFLLLEGLERTGLRVDRSPQQLVQLIDGFEGVHVFIGLALLAVVVAPVVEELVFRGAFYRFLKSRMPRNAAYAVSAACFALLHANLASFLPLFFLGVALAVVYEVTGNIKVPILVHAFFNGHSLLFLFLGNAPAATLFLP